MINTTMLAKSASAATTVALLDGPTGGKTTRGSSDRALTFTTAQGVSNENPGFDTVRSNVRLTRVKPASDTTASVKGYVQFTSSIPTSEFTASEFADLMAMLVNWLASPERTDYLDAIVDGAGLGSAARLYAGEP